MIGKPEWFTYRVLGWGLRPKTWQGWAYVAVGVAIVMSTTLLPISDAARAWVSGILLTIFVADVLHMMMKLPKVHDERENYHQLLAERNVSFAAVGAIAVIVLFQTFMNRAAALEGKSPFDSSLIVVLCVMAAVKALSTLYLHLKK